MFSDSICSIIWQLLEDVRHYNKKPFEYSLDHKKQIIEALTNLYYIQLNLDTYDLKKYTEEEIMDRARIIAEEEINKIEDESNSGDEQDEDEDAESDEDKPDSDEEQDEDISDDEENTRDVLLKKIDNQINKHLKIIK